jgi:hypothetical protein
MFNSLRRIFLTRSRSYLFLKALSVGMLVGASYPFADIALACRTPTSEACVWGEAYFPLTLGASLVLLGGAVTGLLYALLVRWHRRSRD